MLKLTQTAIIFARFKLIEPGNSWLKTIEFPLVITHFAKLKRSLAIHHVHTVSILLLVYENIDHLRYKAGPGAGPRTTKLEKALSMLDHVFHTMRQPPGSSLFCVDWMA